MTEKAIELLRKFDFHDGHPVRLEWNGTEAILEYQNWQEKLYKFTFKNTAYIQSYGCGASLCEAEISNDTQLISNVISHLEHDWATDGTFKKENMTQFTIRDDLPILTIIFEDVEIELMK